MNKNNFMNEALENIAVVLFPSAVIGAGIACGWFLILDKTINADSLHEFIYVSLVGSAFAAIYLTYKVTKYICEMRAKRSRKDSLKEVLGKI